MFKRLMLIGLLAISGSAMLETEAGARTCALRSSSGTCLIWSGSVECDIVANQTDVGSLSKHPEIECANDAPGLACIICKNPGKKGNLSPGIQAICANIPRTFSASTSIQKGNIQNGTVSVIVDTSPDLSGLNIYCPNTGWIVTDYVPCYVNPTITVMNDTGTLDQVTSECVLPACVDGTLGFKPTTGKFNKEQYLDANDPTKACVPQ